MDTQDLFKECHRLFSYDADSGILTRKVNASSNARIGEAVGCKNTIGYLVVRIQWKLYTVHRIIWLMQTGEMPKNGIDHINCIRADNRWCNLRKCTQGENMRNCGIKKHNKIGLKGVRFNKTASNKNPFSARIVLDGKEIHLGLFSTPEIAHEAYCKASKELHGAFSNTG